MNLMLIEADRDRARRVEFKSKVIRDIREQRRLRLITDKRCNSAIEIVSTRDTYDGSNGLSVTTAAAYALNAAWRSTLPY